MNMKERLLEKIAKRDITVGAVDQICRTSARC